MPQGQRIEIPAPGSNQKFPIYGALNYRSNQVSYAIGYGKNATEFVGFLAQLAQQYHGRHCVLVLDNASYHCAGIVRHYLEELSDVFQVIWLPPYSPELNDIERIWKYVKGASLANYYFGDADSLREAIVEVFQTLNHQTKGELTLRYRDPLSKNLLKVA